jgi:glutamine---fructose-6-phosphate transaminase (isomerizing)
MCGIFGVFVRDDSNFSSAYIQNIVKNLYILSESRGKEASGLVIRTKDSIKVLKEPVPASSLIKSDVYSNLFKTSKNYKGDFKGPGKILSIFGHSRLVTNGRAESNSNNQPVIKNGSVGIHNGIIVNDYKLWSSYPGLKKEYDVDTEILLGLLQFHRKEGSSIVNAVKKTFHEIEGSASIAVLFDDTDAALLATNTGSLYMVTSLHEDIALFSSEKYILQQLLGMMAIKSFFNPDSITQIKPGTGYVVNLSNLQKELFNLDNNFSRDVQSVDFPETKRKIIDVSPRQEIYGDPNDFRYHLTDEMKKEMVNVWERIYSDERLIKRCTKCIMPETMPFVTFDAEGVCNHCRAFERRGSILKGQEALEKLVAQYRRNSAEPDVLVGFSGGRDSSFGLLYMIKTLKLHPLTFIYDWGMVTDLARRNQARVCGKLGIEQIIVSANIKTKRENIRKNFEAWLKKPDLGMVPILMAGDKEFYHYFHKIRKQNNIQLFVFCGGYEGEESSGLFKLGFCGVDRNEKEALHRMTGISLKNKVKLMFYYFKSYLTNPAYINSSIFDTLFAYYSSYILPDDYVYLFEYIAWDEQEIVKTIRDQFDWELETDTRATWRTDDGTAAIYNYIYFTMAGFTEFDIIRCHQIREGKLNRDEALRLIREENKPRFRSIEWYADAIGIEVNRMIKRINESPKLYK